MKGEKMIIQEQSALIGKLIRQIDSIRIDRSHEMSLMLQMQRIFAEQFGGYFPIEGYQA